jgi:hypothetical protein
VGMKVLSAWADQRRRRTLVGCVTIEGIATRKKRCMFIFGNGAFLWLGGSPVTRASLPRPHWRGFVGGGEVWVERVEAYRTADVEDTRSLSYAKYPPAKPGALVREPLKAAVISTPGLLGAAPDRLRRRPAGRGRWVGGRHFIPRDRDRSRYLYPLKVWVRTTFYSKGVRFLRLIDRIRAVGNDRPLCGRFVVVWRTLQTAVRRKLCAV